MPTLSTLYALSYRIQWQRCMDYVVDTRVFDTLRLDRVPGTMNGKTGRMCEFFTTDVKRYTFKLLLGYNDDISLLDWDKIAKVAKINFHYGKGKHTKIDLSEYKEYKKRAKRTCKGIRTKDHVERMLNSRIQGFFNLAEQGYEFRGARETSCFALRQICRSLNLDKETELDYLHKLNNCFYEPLDDPFLIKHTDSRQFYRFSNETLAAHVGLDANDPMFLNAFRQKAKTVKEYGLNKCHVIRAQTYIAVA